MRKKVLATLLAVVMLMGITACGNSAPYSDETAVKEDTESAQESSSEQNTSSNEVVTLNIFINESWWPVDTFTGIIPEAITEATGVTLNVTVTADSSQLGVMIASNELPDIVFTSTEHDRLSNSKLCYSYVELADMYGYDLGGNEEQINIAKSFSSDDDYYCLLNWYDTDEEWESLTVGAPGQCGIFYRKDLLDAAGIALPTTAEEFMDVLGQCKEAYPDMTPFGLGGTWKFQALSTWLGVGDSIYNGSAYYYDSSASAYKGLLKYCNELYRNGYITAEDYANENEADSHQNAYNNKCIFYSWYTSVVNLNQLNSETAKNQEGAEWALMDPIADLNGEVHACYGTSKGWGGTFVSKNCKDPEAAARLISFLCSEEGQKLTLWGREGIDYVEVDGELQFSEEWLETRKSTDKMNEKFNTYFYFGTRQTISLKSDFSGIEEELAEQFTPYGVGYKNYPEIGIAMPTSATDEGVILSKLNETKKVQEAKVIFSDSDKAFETNFEEYMKAMEQIGVSTYNEYMNAKIKEVKEAFNFGN